MRHFWREAMEKKSSTWPRRTYKLVNLFIKQFLFLFIKVKFLEFTTCDHFKILLPTPRKGGGATKKSAPSTHTRKKIS